MNCDRRHWPWVLGLGALALLGVAHYLGWFGLGGAYGWMPGYGMGPGYGRGWFHFGFMGLPMILFWGLIIAVIWGLAGGLAGGRSCSAPPRASGRALDILQERYAKGELSKEQYLEMRKELQD